MRENFVSYLSRLKFDPNLWKKPWAKYLVNIRLVIVLIVTIIGIGIISYRSLPRRLNPEIKIPIVTIVTILPGAGPEDVESLITIPIEDKVNGVKNLDTITSTSVDGASTIIIQFTSGTDVDKARSDVQALVDTVTGLPTDAKTPVVKAVDFEDQPVWTFVVTTNLDTGSLMRFSKVLRDNLKDDPKIDRVETSGLDTQDIEVVLNSTKIREYGLTPLLVSQAVGKAASSYPAGTVNTGTAAFSLTIDKAILSIDDIRSTRLSTPAGQSIQLADVASISEKSPPDQPITYYATTHSKPTRAVQFFVFKKSGVNIDVAGQEAEKVTNETVAQYGNRFQIINILNTAAEITKQFNDLANEFKSTIILVFINLLLFLGLRQAIISSTTVPLTFLSAFSIIHLFGLSLNFLTLFAFLLALGLLIDDTIVTVAAMTRYYATGKFTPQETGLLVWRDFIVPLWSTTITTIWAFLPLLISTGIIGEFIKSIPIVVTATLMSSTTIAVLITLPLMMVALKPQFPYRVIILLRVVGLLVGLGIVILLFGKNALFIPIVVIISALVYVLLRERTVYIERIRTFGSGHRVTWLRERAGYIVNHGLINTEVLSKRYMIIIDKIISSSSARKKTIIALVVFAIVAYLLLPLGVLQNEFFPKSDQDTLYVQVELPAGSNVNTVNAQSLSILPEIQKIPQVQSIVIQSGASLSENGGQGQSANTFLYTLHLIPKEHRNVSSITIADNLRKTFVHYTLGTLTVRELSGGPPAGADVQVKFSGDDYKILNQYADQTIAFLKKQAGVTNVERSIKPGTSKLTITLDKSKLADANLTPDAVSLWLRTYASGFTLDTIKFGTEDKDIIFRIESTNKSPEELTSLAIPTTTGTVVPLSSLGTINLESNPTLITRENGKRTLSVSATVTQGYSVTQTNQRLEQFVKTIQFKPGYTWSTGGVNEENQKSVQSILQAMVLSFLLILITMVIEFGSFRQALLTLLVIPLAIPGVFYILSLTGTPLSFPALIGILALFGIVVTNAIVVVEKINDNRREGMSLHDSIVDAAGSRLEPILLTSITSILGLIPITLSDPLWRGLGGAIISGLLFSGLVKLFFIPVTYYAWFKDPKVKD